MEPDKNTQNQETKITSFQEVACKKFEKLSSTPHGKEISESFRKGKIRESIFLEALKVADNPNLMKKDCYQDYVKALAKGKFPKEGKQASRFLQALRGTESEQQYATEMLKKLAQDSTGPLSNRAEKEHLQRLNELRNQDLEIGTNEIQERIASISPQEEPDQSVFEVATPELLKDVAKLDKAVIEEYKLKTQIEETVTQIYDLAEENYEENKHRIQNLIKVIKKLQEQILNLKSEVEGEQEHWENYLQRNVSKAEKHEHATLESGFEPKKGEKVQVWLMRENVKAKSVPTLDGIEVDPKTGVAQKRLTTLTIDDIYWDKETTDEYTGTRMVSYSMEIDGKKVSTITPYKTFLNFLKTYEGYKEYDDVEEFNDFYQFELSDKKIQECVGESFTAESIKVPETGETEEVTIKIAAVTTVGDQTYVELDKPVTTLSRHELPNSVHSMLYFDRSQKKFPLGKFGCYLKRNRFQREPGAEEMQSILDTLSERKLRESQALVEDKDEFTKEKFKRFGGQRKETLTLPEQGEQTNIVYLDEHRNKKNGKLTQEMDENGEPVYYLEKTGTDDEPTVTRNKLKKRNLIAASNKGDIVDAPQEAQEQTLEPQDTPEPSDYEQTSPDDPSSDQPERKPESSQAQYYEEALPYEDVNKTGLKQGGSESLLRKMWAETRFLSVSDLWEMGKAMWEYYQRRWERRQKEKYSSVGKDIPFFAPEMERINQAAENEQVQQFKESLDQQGVYDIQERLQKTRNKDELKAAISALCEQGQMRWDDIEFWKNVNRFVDGSLAIPIPSNGDPATIISDEDPRTGEDFLKDALDSLWGEGSYNSWRSQSKSQYISSAKEYYQKGNELEGVQGGHARRLGVLLQMHKQGHYVDAHEFEGLILHALDYGKSSMQAKLYYMVEGVAAQSPQGRTILSVDRLAHLNSEMLHKFPLLEYITAAAPRKPGGAATAHRFTIDDYKRWAHWFDQGNPMNCSPTKAVDEFLWKYALPSDDTQNRINKDMRNGENLDHDDMFGFLPPASEQVITDACRSTTGSKKFFTIEGYANAFPGFSQYMRTLSETNNRNKLVEAVVSYVRFEGIMQNRFQKEKDYYQRMDDVTLTSPTIVTSTPPIAFINELNSVIEKIAYAYGDAELIDTINTLRTETGDISQKANRTQQDKVNFAFERFSKIFRRVVKSDNGEKMTAIVHSANLEGMPFSDDEAKDRRKAEFKNKFQLQY